MHLKSKASPPGREPRAAQREKLVACAETAIAVDGLAALRARTLAECAGCSIGSIYNLVADLDELVLLVGQRTLTDLNSRLDEADPVPADFAEARYARFIAWALAYCAFAAENRNRWRALFEFRLAPGHTLPAWFEADQARLFDRLEAELAAHFPALDLEQRRLRARTLFSAVHGIVALGLEEKIATMPVATLEAEIRTFVRAYLTGVAASHPPP